MMTRRESRGRVYRTRKARIASKGQTWGGGPERTVTREEPALPALDLRDRGAGVCCPGP